MGSMLKFDSDRRELVRERRQARMERKALRREDRERKRTTTATIPTASTTSTRSGTQRAADELVRDHVERIVEQALDRHDQRAAAGNTVAPTAPDIAARRPARRARPVRGIATSLATPATRSLDADEQLALGGGAEGRERRVSRRERDLAAFRERRQHAADTAREEARARIARSGELASVADALAALAHPAGVAWTAEREQLERALETGRFSEVGAQARRALWAIARDAARTSPRAPRDPDLALAACVAYAIIARAPRSEARTAPVPPPAFGPSPAARSGADTTTVTAPADITRVARNAAADTHAQPVKEKTLMHNPVTATHDPVERDITAPPSISACDPGPARFTPLFTRTVELATTTVTDELGRPLVGVFVPNGELL